MRVAACRRPGSSAASDVSAGSYNPLLLFKSSPDLDAAASAPSRPRGRRHLIPTDTPAYEACSVRAPWLRHVIGPACANHRRGGSGPVFMPCRHLDSLNRAGRLHTRSLRSGERTVGTPNREHNHLAQFLRPWTFRAYPWRRCRRRVHGADTHSTPGHSAGTPRARSMRHRANRHRQDRRVRTTNSLAPRRRFATSGTANLPRPCAEPDEGISKPDRG